MYFARDVPPTVLNIPTVLRIFSSRDSPNVHKLSKFVNRDKLQFVCMLRFVYESLSNNQPSEIYETEVWDKSRIP